MSSAPVQQQPPVRIYFLSSGNIAIPILDALRSDPRVQLMGIGSQPDRPVGRKQILTPTAFARHALESGFEVQRLSSVNKQEFLDELQEKQVEILLVVAFGQLLKAPILALPKYGCLNVHASLLPKYRGACPINAAILNGDAETGVAFMQMEAGLDTGPVYHTCRTLIGETETTGELEERLGKLAADNIGQILWSIAREGLQPVPQPPTTEPNVRKINKHDGAIDWSASAQHICNMVRAYQPWPRAFTYLPVQGQMRRIQVIAATAHSTQSSGAKIGQVLPDDSDELCVACGSGILHIHRVIPEGRKEMAASDYLRGNPVVPGTILE